LSYDRKQEKFSRFFQKMPLNP